MKWTSPHKVGGGGIFLTIVVKRTHKFGIFNKIGAFHEKLHKFILCFEMGLYSKIIKMGRKVQKKIVQNIFYIYFEVQIRNI